VVFWKFIISVRGGHYVDWPRAPKHLATPPYAGTTQDDCEWWRDVEVVMAYSMVHISEFAWKHNHENSQKNRSQRSRIESRNSEIRNRIAKYYTVVVLTYEVLFQPKHESYSRSATIHKQVFLPVQTGLLHRLQEHFFSNCATFTNISCRQVSGVLKRM
jgi:hypothetical protein